MQGSELRRVRKPARSQTIQSEKVAGFVAAESQVGFADISSKGTVRPENLTTRLMLPKTRSGRRVHHKACLLAKLGRRRTRHEFHSLQGVQRNLRREYFALLIIDWLAVNLKRCAGVIAQWMEKSIG